MQPQVATMEQEPNVVDSVPGACANCATPRTGPYCAQCGQRQRNRRLTFRGIVARTVEQAFSLDRGLARTVVDLLRRPQGVVADYISGRTVPYTDPVRFFLVWFTVAQVLSLWTGTFEGAAGGWVDARDSVEGESVESIAATIERFYMVGAALHVPLLAVWTRLIFHRRRYNLAEHTVFHLYTMGQAALGWCVLLLAVQLAGRIGTWIEIAGFVLIAGLYLWSGGRFFGRRTALGVLGTALAVVLAVVSFGAGLSIVMKQLSGG